MLDEESVLRLLNHQRDERVFHFSLERYEKKAVLHRFGSTNRFELEVAAHITLYGGRNREDPKAVLAENLHERTVLKLHRNFRTDFKIRKPEIDAPPHGGSSGRKEERRTIKRFGKLSPVALRERFLRKKGNSSGAEKVAEGTNGRRRIERLIGENDIELMKSES